MSHQRKIGGEWQKASNGTIGRSAQVSCLIDKCSSFFLRSSPSFSPSSLQPKSNISSSIANEVTLVFVPTISLSLSLSLSLARAPLLSSLLSALLVRLPAWRLPAGCGLPVTSVKLMRLKVVRVAKKSNGFTKVQMGRIECEAKICRFCASNNGCAVRWILGEQSTIRCRESPIGMKLLAEAVK